MKPINQNMTASNNTKPKHDLAAGILNQARSDLRRFQGATRAAKRELYLDAYSWIVSDSCHWPFSFRNVCDILNLSPEYVRQEIFRDASSGAFYYWSRRVGSGLRQFHICLRQALTTEAEGEGSKTGAAVTGAWSQSLG
jgi:hypothetical protein